MITWRDRGYVQDSDDEEDDQERTTSTTFVQDGGIYTNLPGDATDQSNASDRKAKAAQALQPVVVIDDHERNQSKNITPSDPYEAVKKNTSSHPIPLKYLSEPKRTAIPRTRDDSKTPASDVGFEKDDIDELQRDTNFTTTFRRITEGHQPKAQAADIYDVPSSPPETKFQDSLAAIRTDAPVYTRHSSTTPSSSLSSLKPTEPSQTTPPTSQPSTSSPPVAIQITTLGSDLLLAENPGKERRFRPRNPIQLHPYALENEMYRQTLQARGVRPVVVTREDLQVATNVDGNDTQPQEAPSDHSEDDLFADSALDSSENFPVLHQSMGPDLLDETITSSERRATFGFSMHGSVDDELHHLPGNATISKAQAVAEGPKGKLKRIRRKRFRIPLGFIPAAPPSEDREITPSQSDDRLSSENESNGLDGLHSIYLGSHASLASPLSPHSSIRSHTDLQEHDSSDSDSRNRLSTVRKRLRGVLPASWLRLNQQSNGTTKQRGRELTYAHSSRPTTTEVPLRGMARPVTPGHLRLKTREPTSPNIMEIPDDEEDNFEAGVTPSSVVDPTSRHISSLGPQPTNDTQDVFEDDIVDPMIPGLSRKRRKLDRAKKQSRLIESFTRPEGEALRLQWANQDRKPKSIQNSHADTAARKRLRPKSAPRMGVVDAAALQTSHNRPDFVRLAVRGARHRADCGRHRPTAKMFHLQSREDNVEIDSLLLDWEEGRRQQHKPASSRAIMQQERVPLSEIANSKRQRLLPTIAQQELVPKHLVCQPRPKQRLYNSTHKPRLKQSRLDVNRMSTIISDVAQRGIARQPGKSSGKYAVFRANHRQSTHFRPGQLEDLHDDNEHPVSNNEFTHQLHTLDHRFENRQAYQQRVANPLLERYLEAGQPNHTEENPQRSQQTRSKHSTKSLNEPAQLSLPIRQLRKRIPHRLDVNAFDLDEVTSKSQPAEILPVPAGLDELKKSNGLQGLGQYGTYYTADFDVRPFPVGTYFHQSTFIGSGQLRHVIHSFQRDLDQPCAPGTGEINNPVPCWGAWSDEVSTRLDAILERVTNAAEALSVLPISGSGLPSTDACGQVVIEELKSVIAYFSNGLHFFDPIDRISFVTRISRHLKDISMTLTSVGCNMRKKEPNSNATKPFTVRFLTCIVVVSAQLLHVAQVSAIQTPVRDEIEQIFRAILDSLAAALLSNNLRTLWTATSITTQPVEDTIIINKNQSEIESLVILHHILPDFQIQDLNIWSVLAKGCLHYLNTLDTVIKIDNTWHDIFVMLPVLHFDSSGILTRNITAESSSGVWTLVKPVLTQVLALYPESSGPSLNAYMRATLSRCFYLVSTWHVSKAETILGSIFDFFARRAYQLLSNEHGHISASSLSTLTPKCTVKLEATDRSFDIFLKTLYTGLCKLENTYLPKKIFNIAWRFIPNGVPTLDKDKDLHEADLCARRNHHHLLCTLYCASPIGHRLDVNLIRDLVDYGSAHSEICRLNIRCWKSLLTFHLLDQESPVTVLPFASWYNHIVHALLEQHRNARSEAIKEAEVSNSRGENLPPQLVEATIANNEKEVEGLLKSVLGMMRDAVQQAPKDADAAVGVLIGKTVTADIFKLFNAKHPRCNGVVMVALEVYLAYFKRQQQSKQGRGPQQDSEDSQDFGDWSALDEVDEPPSEPSVSKDDISALISPVQQLLSNCFGADSFHEETFLKLSVETWILACQIATAQGLHDWAYYLDPQSSGAWQQLRDTEQTRAYFPYFMARLVQVESSAYEADRDSFFLAWLLSLVEREALLKFQHIFTTTLLNTDSTHALLQNLPFAVNNQIYEYDISLLVLRQRRLALIDAVLCNMRRTVEDAQCDTPRQAIILRQTYSTLLKHFMIAMKGHYQEIQQVSSRGAYIDFVQEVVTRLHQYTSDICPVDPFFTDSAAFPLPSSDPGYVVGRLKGYAVSKVELGAQKKLAVFLQSLCERAILNRDQAFLAKQLAKAISDQYEQGDNTTTTLRVLFLCGIVPSYVESISLSQSGWLAALPFLDASSEIMDDLIFRFSPSDISASEVVKTMIMDFLQSTCVAVDHFCTDTYSTLTPHVLKTLSAIFRCMARAACVVDYLHRQPNSAHDATKAIVHLASTAHYILNHINSHNLDTLPPHPSRNPPQHPTSARFSDLRAFTKHELLTTLNNHWIQHEGHYYVVRGSTRREIVLDVRDVEEEREEVKHVLEEFLNVLGRMPAFRGHGGWREDASERAETGGNGNERDREDWKWEDGLVML